MGPGAALCGDIRGQAETPTRAPDFTVTLFTESWLDSPQDRLQRRANDKKRHEGELK
jgi:hypothetical protein